MSIQAPENKSKDDCETSGIRIFISDQKPPNVNSPTNKNRKIITPLKPYFLKNNSFKIPNSKSNDVIFIENVIQMRNHAMRSNIFIFSLLFFQKNKAFITIVKGIILIASNPISSFMSFAS
jgi:hypothetical protein